MESENRTTGSNHESLVLEVPRDEEVTHELAPAQIKSFFNRLLTLGGQVINAGVFPA
jgi:hypothetical protein